MVSEVRELHLIKILSLIKIIYIKLNCTKFYPRHKAKVPKFENQEACEAITKKNKVDKNIP